MFNDLDDFDPNATLNVRDRRLDRQQFNIQHTLPPESIRYNIDNFYGESLARMTAYVYSESLGRYIHEWKYPSSWWQHFKRDHFPKWLLDRYPVQYTTNTIVLDGQAMYPNYRPPRGFNEPFYMIREIDGLGN